MFPRRMRVATSCRGTNGNASGAPLRRADLPFATRHFMLSDASQNLCDVCPSAASPVALKR